MNCRFFVSHFNFAEELRSSWRLPEHVIVNDCTLREGEQFFGLSADEKIMVACEIDEIGVKQIQGGNPGRSKTDGEAIKAMKKAGIEAKIEALSVAFGSGYQWKKSIDAAIDSDADLVNIVFPSSDLHLQKVMHISRETMLDIVVSAVEYAKEHGFYTTFSSLDTTRTDLAFLTEIHTAIVEAGADRLCLCDTVGVITPAGMRFLVENVKRTINVPLSVHCHNDLGLALANSLAAVEGGAEVVDATINGIGERAGNASLDELVVALNVFYGIDTGIRTEKLYEISNHVGKLFNFPSTWIKPLVGKRAFTHGTDTHVRAIATFPFAIEGIDPGMVGNKRKIVISKYAGPYIVKVKANELGIDVPIDRIEEVTLIVQKKAIEKKGDLTDEEFLKIASTILPKD